MLGSMAARAPPGNNAAVMTHPISFVDRGGWWVAVQVPALALAVALPPWTSPVQGPPAQALQWLGLALGVVGVALATVALLSLAWRRALTPFPRPSARAQLATRGVYGLMRHPLYSGVLAAALGWALLWLSVSGVVYALLLALFFDRKAALEEVWLRRRFPDYAAYAERVRKFIPGVY